MDRARIHLVWAVDGAWIWIFENLKICYSFSFLFHFFSDSVFLPSPLRLPPNSPKGAFFFFGFSFFFSHRKPSLRGQANGHHACCRQTGPLLSFAQKTLFFLSHTFPHSHKPSLLPPLHVRSHSRRSPHQNFTCDMADLLMDDFRAALHFFDVHPAKEIKSVERVVERPGLQRGEMSCVRERERERKKV